MIGEKKLSTAASVKSIFRRMPLGVRLILSIVFLIGSIVYTISPIDLIPDFLGPLGWVDDILVWILVIAADMKLLIQQGMVKAKKINAGMKKKDGFFTEDIND